MGKFCDQWVEEDDKEPTEWRMMEVRRREGQERN